MSVIICFCVKKLIYLTNHKTTMNKYYLLALVPLVLALLFWSITTSFHLISAPSDRDVIFGVVLLSISILILIKSILYVKQKFFKP